ncbi:alpha/beta hydrolase family protein [Dyella sp. 2RAB6]|uniref:alpha/beta hydrolase family protein n=1 Tax=Dyella sp. 2RAB6 TaxID=3232992 RepID=UPI003F9121DF
MNTVAAASGQALTLVAQDGYRLGAVLYPANGKETARIVVGSATGVPQGFYRRFAEFANAHGYTVLTMDYRGVGASRPASLKGFEMRFLDWATQDLAAAVEHLAEGDTPLYLVGHSFGGHALGLLPNHQRLAGAYLFGVGAGWHGWMPQPERTRIWLAWNVLLPMLTHWKGYMPWKLLGAGEDLPMGVYRDWRRWCRFPHYFFDDPAMSHMADVYARVRTPIVAANAVDDLWALPRSRDAFIGGYRHAPLQRRDVDAKKEGYGSLGHMGYFRQHAQPLWEEALAWFKARSASTAEHGAA